MTLPLPDEQVAKVVRKVCGQGCEYPGCNCGSYDALPLTVRRILRALADLGLLATGEEREDARVGRQVRAQQALRKAVKAAADLRASIEEILANDSDADAMPLPSAPGGEP